MLLVYLQCYYGMYKVRKTARIRNPYNQVLHLSQDTKWKSNKITINITNKSQEVSLFPSGDRKAVINRRESIKRSTALEQSVKYFTRGPKLAPQCTNLTLKPVLMWIMSAWTHQCYIWARMIKFWTPERPRQNVQTLKNTYSGCFIRSSLIRSSLFAVLASILWVLSL